MVSTVAHRTWTVHSVRRMNRSGRMLWWMPWESYILYTFHRNVAIPVVWWWFGGDLTVIWWCIVRRIVRRVNCGLWVHWSCQCLCRRQCLSMVLERRRYCWLMSSMVEVWYECECDGDIRKVISHVDELNGNNIIMLRHYSWDEEQSDRFIVSHVWYEFFDVIRKSRRERTVVIFRDSFCIV